MSKQFEVKFIPNTRKIKMINSNNVSHPHGTVISTILTSLCKNVEIISINILDNDLASDGRILIYAIKQAIELKPQIINLSLGTTLHNYKVRLIKLIKKAYKKNIIVVSAAENSGKISYPAFLKGVVGVKRSNNSDNCINYKDNFFIGPGNVTDISEVKNMNLPNACGNSISAAYITGYIAKLVEDGGIRNRKDIIDKSFRRISNE